MKVVRGEKKKKNLRIMDLQDYSTQWRNIFVYIPTCGHQDYSRYNQIQCTTTKL